MTTLFTLSYLLTTTKIKVVVIKVLKYFRKFSFEKMCTVPSFIYILLQANFFNKRQSKSNENTQKKCII